MKTELKNAALKMVKKVVFQSAEKSANAACPMWSYQSKAPAKVQKLRKF